MVGIKRIYEPAAEVDGRRVLVDRLWPRGVSKESARLDEWRKDVAPSPELRAWFCHKDENFERFSELYRMELETDPEKRAAVRHLLETAKAGKLTLLYATKSETVNHAAVLKGVLEQKLGNP